MEKFISMMTTDVRASEDKTNISAGENKTDVSAGEKTSDFVYPPSIQGDLFNYLKPGQHPRKQMNQRKKNSKKYR